MQPMSKKTNKQKTFWQNYKSGSLEANYDKVRGGSRLHCAPRIKKERKSARSYRE